MAHINKETEQGLKSMHHDIHHALKKHQAGEITEKGLLDLLQSLKRELSDLIEDWDYYLRGR